MFGSGLLSPEKAQPDPRDRGIRSLVLIISTKGFSHLISSLALSLGEVKRNEPAPPVTPIRFPGLFTGPYPVGKKIPDHSCWQWATHPLDRLPFSRAVFAGRENSLGETSHPDIPTSFSGDFLLKSHWWIYVIHPLYCLATAKQGAEGAKNGPWEQEGRELPCFAVKFFILETYF